MKFNTGQVDVTSSGSNRLNKPGTYHLQVDRIHDGVFPKGNMIEGGGFCVEFTCLGGTEDPCKERNFQFTFFNPNLSYTEKSQAWSIKKQAAFLFATNLMRPDQLGVEVDIDLAKGEGAQVIMQLEYQTDADGKTKLNDGKPAGLDLVFANIYHVDDPRAKPFLKIMNQEAIATLPPAWRHKDEAYFAPLMRQKKDQQAASAAPAVSDFNDLM